MIETTQLSSIQAKLDSIEEDMVLLERENERLRANCTSTYFERDACVSLIAKMAAQMGLNVGRSCNRVIVDLPAGQVSWEYLDDEAHLFAALPEYAGVVQEQSIQDIYSKVMNPGLT